MSAWPNASLCKLPNFVNFRSSRKNGTLGYRVYKVFCTGVSKSSCRSRIGGNQGEQGHPLHKCRTFPVSASKVETRNCRRSSSRGATMGKRPPVLLLDVMGTLVRDPFYEDIPAFFGMSMKELLAEKHPTSWIDFETGQLTEDDLLKKFFADGRDFNLRGLKECMSSGYNYLEGMEELLQRLHFAKYDMHAFSNYPFWIGLLLFVDMKSSGSLKDGLQSYRYSMIEEKLQLSRYLPWTFMSCHMGLRKPDARIYLEAAEQLKLDPSSCIFIDDRRKNVEVAVEVGMLGIVFKDAKQLEQELAALGCHL